MAISRSARITLLLCIDVVFFLVELIAGYAVGSLALVADSFHMLNDIMSLIVALYAIKLTAQKTIDTRYSYGWHRAEILAALVNGVFLLALCFSIFMEALERFFSTPEISSPRLVVIVGSLGLLSNFVGLFLFHEHDHSHDEKIHNERPVSTAQEVDDGGSGTVTPTQDEQRDRRRSDDLYGHPVATRAYFVQAAHDLQVARSPSRDESSSGKKQEGIHSILSSESTVVDDNEEAVDVSETSPLLHKQPVPVTTPGQSAVNGAASIENGKAKPHKKGHSGHAHGSMNMRALVLHVMGDALGNVGVIATGLVIWLTDYSWRFYFDPIISLVITVIIFSSALPLVKSASFILLQGVPSGISLEEVDEAIRAVDGVQSVHELHVWQLSETKIVASVHVLASKKNDFMQVAADIRRTLHDHGIHSSTIQPEYYHSSRGHLPDESSFVPSNASCLLPCPPGQECNPAENACCPPPPSDA